jgi:single-stranded DNA-binding protein
MNSVNKVTLTGNLARDPVALGEKRNVAVATVMSNEHYSDRDNKPAVASYPNDIVAYGDQAHELLDNFKSGDGIKIKNGRTKKRSYDDKHGTTIYTQSIEITADTKVKRTYRKSENISDDDTPV